MFDTCRDARAYSHESREFTKEAHRIQNADWRASGQTTAPNGPELAPSTLVEIPMSEITNEHFDFGVPSAYGFGGAPWEENVEDEHELDRASVDDEASASE